MSYEPTNPNEPGASTYPSSTATMPVPPVTGPAPVMATAARPNAARRVGMALGLAAAAAVAALLLVIALTGAVVIGVIAGLAIDSDTEEITHAVSTVDEIPTSIVSEKADVVLDLSSLSAADFADRSEPLSIDIDVEFGAVEVIVPDGIAVSVDAETEIGSTTVFGEEDNGVSNRVVADGGADADIDLTIDVDAGDVDVERR
jgi:hypothetical protein